MTEAKIKVYEGYVSYYIKNLGQSLSNGEWRDVLKSNLGATPLSASLKLWKEFALKLYYIHFIELSLKVDTDDLIKSKRKFSDLRSVLIDSDKFREEHDLGELSVVHYVIDEDAIKHMKKFYAPESVIEDILKVNAKTTKTAKPTATKTAKSTTKAGKSTTKTIKSTAKSAKTVDKSLVKSTTKNAKAIPAFLVVKQGRKNVTLTKREDIIKHLAGEVAKVSPKAIKNVKSTTKTCDSYTIIELKKLAQEKGVDGRSKMNKAQLCAALKIK